MIEGHEYKRADKIVIGDYLPFRYHRQEWWLEVVRVQPKRTRVWITVLEPGRDERFTTRPPFDVRMAFKEGATMIEEAEAQLQEETPA